jgi:hypothetical protein
MLLYMMMLRTLIIIYFCGFFHTLRNTIYINDMHIAYSNSRIL